MMVPPLRRWQFPSEPALPVLGIHSREKKAYVQIRTCTQMCMAVLVKIVKNGKEPNVHQKVTGQIVSHNGALLRDKMKRTDTQHG